MSSHYFKSFIEHFLPPRMIHIRINPQLLPMVPLQGTVHPPRRFMELLTARHPLSSHPRLSLQLDMVLLTLRPHRRKLLPQVLDLLHLKHKLEPTFITMEILLMILPSNLLHPLFHLMVSLFMILHSSLQRRLHNMNTMHIMKRRNSTL